MHKVQSFEKNLHDEACELLQMAGVGCTDQRVIKDFESTGYAVYDVTTKRIHILKDLVDQSLELVPKRDKFPVPEHSFGGGGNAAFVKQGDDYIHPTLDIHVAEVMRTAEEFDIPFMFRGVGKGNGEYEDVYQLDVIRKYYSGYLFSKVETKRGIERCLEDYNLHKKICIVNSILTSPLKMNEVGNNLDIFYDSINAGLPLYFVSVPMSGINAPITMYGLCLQAHAEYLVGLSLAQAIKPGITVVNGAFPTAGDPVNMDSQPLGSLFHNMANYYTSIISKVFELPAIQSGCTITSRDHNPMKQSTDFETERAYKMWNGLEGWHMLRHCFGFVDNLTTFNMNKMRRDLNCLKKVIENDEKSGADHTGMWADSDAFDAIIEAINTKGGNFSDIYHTTKHFYDITSRYQTHQIV